MKKFIKKIGRKIKKIGKEIGKPFKKLMKTKLGKIIGTIGMMMIGGWMLAGAKSFVGTMWAGKGMGAAFSNGISAMGNAAATSYSTITGGIEGMFGKTATTQKASSEALANSTVTGTDFASNAVVSGGQAPNIIADQIANIPPPTSVQASAARTGGIDFAQSIDALANTGGNVTPPLTEATLEATNASTVGIVGDTDAAGNVITGEAAGDVVKIKSKPKSILDKTDDFATVEGYEPVRSGRNLQDRIARKATGTENLRDKLGNLFYDSENITAAWDTTLGFKPFKNMPNAPKFVQGTNLAELKTGYEILQKPEEPYFGSSDMTGAYAALDVNAQRLYTGNTPSMAELGDGRTSIPSPSLIGAADYLNNTRKAGFLWDTSLLAVNPSKIV